MTTIFDLYDRCPKLPLAKAFLGTLSTESLLEIKDSVEEEIRNFRITSSLLNIVYENYCVEVHRYIKKLLKTRVKQGDTIAKTSRRKWF